MRLQQMLFVAFASTVLLIGCSKSEEVAISDLQPMHQISQMILTSNIQSYQSEVKQIGALILDHLFLYKNNVKHSQSMSYFLNEASIHSVINNSLKQGYSFLSPYQLLSSLELFYQKEKIMIRGETSILNA